jgi:hypothetical protein
MTQRNESWTGSRLLAFAMLAFAMLAGCQGAIGDVAPPSDRPPDAPPPGGCVGDECRTVVEAPAPGSRYPRLTHAQWENTVAALFALDGPAGLSSDFNADPSVGAFDSDERRLVVTDALWRDYQRAAEALAERVTRDDESFAWLPDALPEDGVERRDAFVREFGLRAFRRPLGDDEVGAIATLFDLGPEAFPEMDPFAAGVRIALEAILQSPFFVYRVERSKTVAGGLVELDGYELANRLSYFVWDSMPDDDLFAAAADGSLANPETFAAQAERMLDDRRARAKLERFHDEIFQIGGWIYNEHSLPEWRPELAEMMQTEARLFIDDVIVGGGNVQNLLTSNVAFVNEDMASFYGVSGISGTDYQRVELDRAERAGILTRLGFLTKNTDDQPDPVHRGVFISEQILCRNIPPPPEFDPLLHQPEGETNRERYESITGPGTGICATCHTAFINPLGFAFESYDALGRLREDDNGHPIDDSASYVTEDGRTLEYDGGIELSNALADLPAVHQCYAGRLLEFAYGRPLADVDSPLVFRMSEGSVEGDPIRDLVMELVTSRSFRTRAAIELTDAVEEAP